MLYAECCMRFCLLPGTTYPIPSTVFSRLTQSFFIARKSIATEQMLRQMSPADLPEVNLLLSKAFTHGNIQDGLHNRRVPLCRIAFLEYYLHANPGGALVIENDGIAAYCFSRQWGTLAWLGPLSVIPAQQGRGLGKKIVRACIAHLQGQGAATIGLEMMAGSGRNLAFYTGLGFEIDKPAIDLIRPLTQHPESEAEIFETVFYSRLSPAEQTELKAAASTFSRNIHAGLDYSSEMAHCLHYGFGDTVILKQNHDIAALMIAHTETYSNDEKRQFLKVNILQISPDLPITTLDACLHILEEWARDEGLTALYVRVPTRYAEGYRYLLSKSFVIAQNDLRLTLSGYGLRDETGIINFSKWE